MTWKSAPQGKMVPCMSGPRTSPPRIGMTRRTPQPMSPATIGAPILMARLNTYFVESCGVIGSARHACRQPQRQYRKQDQDHQPDQVGHHERDHAAEYGGKGHVLDH